MRRRGVGPLIAPAMRCGSWQLADEVCSKLGKLTWAFCGIGDPEGPAVRGHAYRGSRSTGGGVVDLVVEPDSTVRQYFCDGVEVVPGGEQQRPGHEQFGGEQVLHRDSVAGPSTWCGLFPDGGGGWVGGVVAVVGEEAERLLDDGGHEAPALRQEVLVGQRLPVVGQGVPVD